MKLNLSYKVFLWLKLVFTEHISEQREEQQNFLWNVKSRYKQYYYRSTELEGCLLIPLLHFETC